MILTKLFVILLTILLVLEMIKYFKKKLNTTIEGATTMADAAGTSAAGTSAAGTSAAGTCTSTASTAGTAGTAGTGTGAPDDYIDPGINKDPGYLSAINQSNIKYLKNKIDDLVGLKQQLADLSTKVDQNTTNLGKLSSQISDTANRAVGRDPNSTDPLPQASGLN
jgi:hypothetical protein